MTNVLVTGSTGLIGSHLVNHLKNLHNVVSLVHDCRGGKWLGEALKGTVKVRGDVRDFRFLKRVISQYEIEKIFHLAARAKVKVAFKDPVGTYDVNIMGTVNLLEVCRQLDVGKVLLLETDKVYGERMDATIDDELQASEPYATSKVCQEFIANSFIYTYGTDIVIPHSCNVFGLDLYSNRIFPNVIKTCLKGEKPLIFINDDSIREYIYVEDLILALITLMEWENGLGSFNIATNWIYNQEKIVLKILEHFPGLKPEYVGAELPAQIQKQSLKMTRWDWRPSWEFSEAVGETVMMFKEYEGDWR